MKINRYLRCSIAAAALLATSLCAYSATAVVVTKADNSKVTIMLSQKPAVQFTEDAIVVSADDKTWTYSTAEYLTLSIGDSEASVGDIVVSDPVMQFEGGTLRVTGLAGGEPLMAYGIDGRLLASCRADSAGEAHLDLSGRTGIIIIKTNNHSLKIQKQ